MVDELSSEATPRRLVLQLATMAAASFILPRASGAQALEEPAKSPALSEGISTFEGVWQTVRDRFYDPRLNGLDWPAVRERYRAAAAEATSDERLAEVINDMLSELHASHTRYYSTAEPEYYQLAGIFAGALRRRGLDRAFPGGQISYPGIGILSRPGTSGGSVITGVIEGTPAEKALHRAGTVQQLPVTPVEIEPNGMFLDGMKASARVLQAKGRRIGYVHVWSYAGYAYQEALERLLSEGILRDVDALVWDLRDGWGGAVPEYLDLLNPRAPTMRVTDRSGAHEFENVKWRKPVAMLVNGGTRSGKEVLAYGFKKYRLGEVIGTRTEGAVLAATAFLVGRGLLLLAVDDVQVDGERLEGVGVAPTIEVQPASGGGDDPQLNRAVALLSA
jgi:carboxyl-terminal processing protease